MVDDDPGVLRLLSANLEARGYDPWTFNSAGTAMLQLNQSAPDLIILDVMLPGADGIDRVRWTRESSAIPIMMISGRQEIDIRLEALDLGADDYLTKPFSIDELMARVRCLLRRSGGLYAPDFAGIYHYGDLDRIEIARAGLPVKLSAREWAVLRVFIKYVGRVVTPRMLLQQVWGPEYGDEGDYVRTYVTRLRKKLEPEPHNPRYILNERGIGYRLVSPN